MTLPTTHHESTSVPRLNAVARRVLRSATTLHVVLLAMLAYLPTLTARPGRMPTDTKLFLYLDPARLTGDALSSWDSRQFAGWVPHQTVSYLWPSGPWYSLFEALGVPDWVAQRLWIATLMFAAGLGVRWAARLLGLATTGALIAALFYQLSPYILPYISRTSTMLLPWAGLGWLIGLTIRAATRTRWRDAGIFGLVIATVGATNATATLMIAPGPLLWLAHAAWERSISWRRAIAVAAKLGALSLVMSAWWIAMLAVQSRYGADVLGYSETLEAVSLTSSSTEVVRGLGYWLFYVRDPVGFTTTAAFDYMASGRAITITFLIVGLALVGLVRTGWTSRRFAVLTVFVGVVLAVGVHPIDDPSPLMAGLAGNSRSSLALAMRSSTRALPLSTLGFALGLGALATAVARTRFRARKIVPILLGVLALANLPVLFNQGFVDPILTRDENPPAAWEQAADALDAMPTGFRVIQLPGTEFGAFRWGYTVDPPLPGMTQRPLVTRDLLPLGSAGAMDLLYALDDRFQDGTVEITAVAAVARLFGADTVWLPNDVAFDRFRTPRPEVVSSLFSAAAGEDIGLGKTTLFGEPAVNEPVISMVDEESVSNPAIGRPLPPVALVEVTDPQPIVRVKTEEVVLAGSGDGIVDAAAAGLLTGKELIRYAADVGGGGPAGARVIVTDTNRDRAHQWHSSQDVWGFTEDGSDRQGVLTPDTSDQRIPVFTDATAPDRTIAEQRGGTRADASAYGEPFAYRPENRAAMAVDGDPSTAWVVADRAEPVGEYLRLTAGRAFSTLRLTQPQDTRNRWITAIELTDASGTRSVRLTDASRSAEGQLIELGAPSEQVTIRIAQTATDPLAVPNALDAVGFAEATTELGTSEEVVRVPSNVLPLVTPEQAVDVVLTRLRTRATNRWRSDPEPSMIRSFTLATAREFTPTLTTRLDLRATDSVIAGLLGWKGSTADRRLVGVPAMGGWAATDGDPGTAWATPFGNAVGATLTIPLAAGSSLDPSGFEIGLRQPAGAYGTVTAVTVRGDAGEQTVAVPAPDALGDSTIAVAGLTGSRLRITIAATSGAATTDRRYAEQVTLPVAFSEVTAAGVVASRLPAQVVTGCRSDLVSIDDRPLPVRVSATVVELFAGTAATTEPCDRAAFALDAGEHLVRSAAGTLNGIDIDRIVLRSPALTGAPGADAAAPPKATVTDNGRLDRTVTVAACPTGCWFVFGEGFNTGWTATSNGRPLGTQQQVDGGFNGWYLPPSAEDRVIRLSWRGQSRLTIGLAISGAGLILCLALILLDRRKVDPPILVRPHFETGWIPPARTFALRRPVIATAVALIAGTLVISPVWGLACAVVTATCGLLRRPQLVGDAAVVITGAIAVIMIRRFLILKPFVNAGWPGYFEDLHRPGMAAIVLLAVSTVARDRPTLSAAARGDR